jgi:hypothetical protein
LLWATAKSAKSKAFTLKSTEGENNDGDHKENCAQDETHRPQDGTESGTRHSQNRPEDGTHRPQDGTEGRTC